MFPVFEEIITDVAAGKTVDLDVNFPEDYHFIGGSNYPPSKQRKR
jgi:FKBP-type peptidyl-prolyl cis-trans isomerase (trigger factor)